MAFADALVDDWLFSRLATGPGRPPELGSVYPDFPPQGPVTFPCLVYAQLDATLLRWLGPQRGLSRFVYLVKVVAPGEASEALRPALDWMDSRLQVPRGQPFALPVGSCDQRGIVRFRQVGDDGVVWLHHGARWDVQVDAA